MVMDDDECRAICGMLGKGNRSTLNKPAPVLLCPPQIPHDLTQAGTRATTMGSRRPTAWSTARPSCFLNIFLSFEPPWQGPEPDCAAGSPSPACKCTWCKWCIRMSTLSFCRGGWEEFEAWGWGQGKQYHHSHEGTNEEEGAREARDLWTDQVGEIS
jgi:hypothetical protein